MKLTCPTHGKMPWNGTVVCGTCVRPYQLVDEHAAHYAPEICVCGVRLVPVSKDEQESSAMPVCAKCFEGLTKKASA